MAQRTAVDGQIPFTHLHAHFHGKIHGFHNLALIDQLELLDVQIDLQGKLFARKRD